MCMYSTDVVLFNLPVTAISSVLEDCDLSQLPSDKLAMLEADCFWCVSKLLDGIQVNI